MLAYMSTPNGRRVYGIFRDDLKEQAAVAEARAILAETEPPFMFALYLRVKPLRIACGDNYNALSALAEALAAFVAE